MWNERAEDALWFTDETATEIMLGDAAAVAAVTEAGVPPSMFTDGTVRLKRDVLFFLLSADGDVQYRANLTSGASSGFREYGYTIEYPNTAGLANRIAAGLYFKFDVTQRKLASIIRFPTTLLPSAIEPETVVPPAQLPMSTLCTSRIGGPAFTLTDNRVSWDRWTFRIVTDPYYGVALEDLTFEGRDVAARVGFAEAMSVYNSEYSAVDAALSSTDAWSYPMAARLVKLEPGLDLPDYATLIDLPDVHTNGSVYQRTDVIGLFEESAGSSARATVPAGNRVFLAQSLKVRFAFSGGAYLWVFDFTLKQAGSFAATVKVTGRDYYLGVGRAYHPYGRMISKNRFGMNHNHHYSLYINWRVDGPSNSLLERKLEPVPADAGNGAGQAIAVVDTYLQTELDHRDLTNDHFYAVVNRGKTNYLGRPTGYSITPMFTQTTMQELDTSWPKRNLCSTRHDLIVTKRKTDEKYVAGEYPYRNGNVAGSGLCSYMADDESILDTDLVTWLSLNFNHVPISEDYIFTAFKVMEYQFAPHDFLDTSYAAQGPSALTETPAMSFLDQKQP